MTKAANRAKTRWNAANYRQIKVSVDPAMAAAFREACAAAGVSMASVLTNYMAQYAKTATVGALATAGPLDSKRKRRNVVASLARQMEQVRDAQLMAMENIPEGLRDAGAYDAAQESVDVMEEVIDRMWDIY